MEDQNEMIDALSKKIERLMQQNQFLHTEILSLQKTLNDVKQNQAKRLQENAVNTEVVTEPPITQAQSREASETITENINIDIDEPVEPVKPVESAPLHTIPPLGQKKTTYALEEFVGTNLLNKIGIAVLVVGIGFGTKYAIDHQLLSALTRIVLGYISSVILLVIAIRLKKRYASFSAVLLSGGMAALYFVTYAAYDFYDLIPQPLAFALMVLFTVFTCFAAIQYNMQVIAVIGLVGAYGVPFLLSDGSGHVEILFSYMAVINTGILALGFKKYWKALYYLAFIFTWGIYATWFITGYHAETNLWMSLAFGTIFFLIFYITFLSYKLLRKEPLERIDVVMVMLNSFIYFGYGYTAIDFHKQGGDYLGLFAVFTAVLHFIGAVIIYKKQAQFKDIFFLVAGMVLVFLTLAVPIQLEGHWVTLIWAGEAFLLFWIGRSKSFPVYEKLSYLLILLAFGSLAQDWQMYYGSGYYYVDRPFHIPLFLNIQFFTSLWVALAFALILFVASRQPGNSFEKGSMLHHSFRYGLPLLLGLVIYFGFFKEIETYWIERYYESKVEIKRMSDGYDIYDEDLLQFKTIWLINYSAIFTLALSVINLRFIKDKMLSHVCVALNAVVITIFLTAGLLAIADLRQHYINQEQSEYFIRGFYHLAIRYISILLTIPLIICNYWQINKTGFFPLSFQKLERVLFHLVVLTLLSSELVHLLNLLRIDNSFKLALSILWGVYALSLIILGLWKDQKHIRITAIVLFGITLAKLFLYDMAAMSTISKTVVMMILGVLMLTASFLYNKYKRSNEGQ